MLIMFRMQVWTDARVHEQDRNIMLSATLQCVRWRHWHNNARNRKWEMYGNVVVVAYW